MTEQDVVVRELLERHTPLRPHVEPDWEDVLRRAGVNDGVSAPRMSVIGHLRRPRMLALALFLLVLLGTGVALAVDGLPWWQDAPPPQNPGAVEFELAKDVDSAFPPAPDSSHAVAVAKAGEIELVAAPVAQDGYCLAIFVNGLSVAGHSCEYQATGDARSLAMASPPTGSAFWVVFGRIVHPDAAAVDLSEAAGVPLVSPLHYQGFFLARVPSDRWSALSNGAGEARILDRAGRTLSTRCVNWGPAPGDRYSSARYGLWGENATPCQSTRYPWMIEVTQATKLVELPLIDDWDNYAEAGQAVALWRAPQPDGTVCVLDALAASKPTPGRAPVPPLPPGHNPPWGFNCNREDALLATPPGKPIAVQVSYGQNSGQPAHWHFEGHVNPSSGIVRMALDAENAKATVAYANGWFLGQLPQSNSFKEFPTGGPFVLVGFAADGREVARVDLRNAWQAELRGQKIISESAKFLTRRARYAARLATRHPFSAASSSAALPGRRPV
jgi:hypothetical protein